MNAKVIAPWFERLRGIPADLASGLSRLDNSALKFSDEDILGIGSRLSLMTDPIGGIQA